MSLTLLILVALFFAFLSSKIYINFFQDKKKIINKEMYKLVGSSGTTLTNVSELFGIVSVKDDDGINKNIVCYSYREKISKGFRVLVTDYDSTKEMYIIDEYPR